MALLLLVALLVAVGISTLSWGWHGPLDALTLQVLLMWWALFLLWATRPVLLSDWFTVRRWEAPLYRRLGAYRYRDLLRAVGWERVRREAQGFKGNRATLSRYEHHTREAEYSHVLLGLLNLGLIGWLWRVGRTDTALWLGLTGIFFHVYPVMLQRALRSRLAKLLQGGNSSG